MMNRAKDLKFQSYKYPFILVKKLRAKAKGPGLSRVED